MSDDRLPEIKKRIEANLAHGKPTDTEDAWWILHDLQRARRIELVALAWPAYAPSDFVTILDAALKDLPCPKRKLVIREK